MSKSISFCDFARAVEKALKKLYKGPVECRESGSKPFANLDDLQIIQIAGDLAERFLQSMSLPNYVCASLNQETTLETLYKMFASKGN